ncbi:MAG: hypothetical protein JWO06_1382 [Bacteroidota bacterium]|nr:hypothetical protein [Bacteroidota bacterium]
MDALDVMLLPVYLGIFYFLAYRTLGKNSKDPLYKKYYIRGLNYKLFGSISFAFIYVYYYKGGDTISFYWATSPLFKLFFSDPVWFFKFALGLDPHYPGVCGMEAAQHSVIYLLRGSATLTTIRIASIIDVFCMNSFTALSVAFGYISYLFIWRLFRLFVSIYPTLHKQFAIAFLMIPSAIFWGSGLGKDTIMNGSIMAIVYCFYKIVILKKITLRHVLMFFVCAYLIALIRGFILFTILPCLMLMTVVYYRNSINNSFVRFVVGPIFILVGVGASFLLIRSLGDSVQSYKLDSLAQKAEGFRSWHTYLGKTEGGSSYSIGGDIQYTPLGILKQAPVAIITTLFGPFPWQIRNFVMLLSGIESLAFLYFTVQLLFNKKIYKLFGVLFGDPIVVFCLAFIFVLSIAIGLTSFNYGALVRYRIPVLPFFATTIILINHHLNENKMIRKRQTVDIKPAELKPTG